MNVPMQDHRVLDFGAAHLDLFADVKKVLRTTTGTALLFSRVGHRGLGSGHHQQVVARRPGVDGPPRAVLDAVG